MHVLHVQGGLGRDQGVGCVGVAGGGALLGWCWGFGAGRREVAGWGGGEGRAPAGLPLVATKPTLTSTTLGRILVQTHLEPCVHIC